MSDQLGEHLRESLSPGGKWIEFPSFQGGCGTLYRNEIRRRITDIWASWFADADTFEDPWHLPVLATATTPTGISALKTDYAAIGEYYLGSWQVVLVKGTDAYSTTGAAFGAAKKHLASAQGRQLIYAPYLYADTTSPALIWIAGAGANVQFTTDGTTWADLGDTGMKALCGWVSTSGALYVVRASDNTLYYLSVGSAWTAGGQAITPRTSTGVIPLGKLGTTDYYANGPYVANYHVPLGDITAGCVHKDRFGLTDGRDIIWFLPEQPEIHIPIWRKDGMPPDRAGSVKSLISLGDYLVALYELDAGGSVIYWGGPFNSQGDFPWHQRRVSRDDEFPLSIGSTVVLASQTYTASQRLWTIGANGSTGYAVRQDYPKRSYNPLNDSAMQYESATTAGAAIHLFTPRVDLVQFGSVIGMARQVFHLAELGTTETLAVAYRVNPFTEAESVDASWTVVTTLYDLLEGIRLTKSGRDGVPARQIQFRFTINRGDTVTATPKVNAVGVYCDSASQLPKGRAVRA